MRLRVVILIVAKVKAVKLKHLLYCSADLQSLHQQQPHQLIDWLTWVDDITQRVALALITLAVGALVAVW